jgi:AcrR family transcriptional regulator
MPEAVLGRYARKRLTILEAGRDLFLSNGYQGTSVDQIAASAAVSKQTVYKHFGDKHELLLSIVNEALNDTVAPFLDRIAALADAADLEIELTGSPSWPSSTTRRHPPARCPPSPPASRRCIGAASCTSLNLPSPQSISRS